jgi:hypothetical protein
LNLGDLDMAKRFALLAWILFAASRPLALGDAAAADGTYVWFAELMNVDKASNSFSLRVRFMDEVGAYVDRFAPGERVLITWAFLGNAEGDELLHIGSYEAMRRGGMVGGGVESGYILPAEFMSSDKATRTVVVRVRVNAETFERLSFPPPGIRVKAISPKLQSSEFADVAMLEAASSKAQALVDLSAVLRAKRQ